MMDPVQIDYTELLHLIIALLVLIFMTNINRGSSVPALPAHFPRARLRCLQSSASASPCGLLQCRMQCGLPSRLRFPGSISVRCQLCFP